MFSTTIGFGVLARVADTNKLRYNLLHVGEGILACRQVKGLPWTPMSAKNTSVALSEGKPHFAARHHDAVMYSKTSIFCARAVVKLERVLPVFGVGSNHRTTEGG